MAWTRWNEERVDQAIGNTLRAGVLLAVAIVAVGAAVFLARHGAERPPDYHVFRGEPGEMRTVSGILEAALRGSGRGIIQLGLLFLIATPVARVILSVAAFAAQGDRKFVVVTLMVLGALLYSLLGALA